MHKKPPKNDAQPHLFADLDFKEVDSPDFKEDSVREEIVKPLLNKLGYAASSKNRIHRSKSLKHPFVTVGAGKKRQITSIPDYLLSIRGKYAWVLDAKAPDEEIKTGDNVEQVFFYAIHPEIRVRIYALCNGKEFIAFERDSDKPLIYCHVSEIEKHWSAIEALLAPEAFDLSEPSYPTIAEGEFDYALAKPLPELKVRKQSAKRHFGVHGYFTRQAWDLVPFNYPQIARISASKEMRKLVRPQVEHF